MAERGLLRIVVEHSTAEQDEPLIDKFCFVRMR
jgi:hypothetical protein